MSRSMLRVIALLSLLAVVLLGFAVAHGHGLYSLERHALELTGPPPSAEAWAHLAGFLAVPVITAVLVLSFVFGGLRRALVRVALYAGLAAAALLLNEYVGKPLVGHTYHAGLSFPSGHVTAVCATALAMWMALFPLLKKWARLSAFVLGAIWVLLMSLAVVGADWHTPVDAIGSVLLSVGVVTAGATVIEPTSGRDSMVAAEPARIGDKG